MDGKERGREPKQTSSLSLLYKGHSWKLAHTIMEAKAQDLQSASWRSRRANGVVSVQRNSRLKTQEKLMFQFKYQGRRKPMSQVKAGRHEGFSLLRGRVSLFVLFRPSTDWMTPPTLRRTIFFTQSTDSSGNTLIDTPRIMFNQVSGHPVAQSS